jgi:hypothetical protein
MCGLLLRQAMLQALSANHIGSRRRVEQWRSGAGFKVSPCVATIFYKRQIGKMTGYIKIPWTF